MSIIFNQIKASYKNNKPFVAYRKPNMATISAFFMEAATLHFTSSFTEKGFVFAPFDDIEKVILFPSKKATFLTEDLVLKATTDKETVVVEENLVEKERHLKLVEKSIQKIKEGFFEKVVISRKEKVLLTDFDLEYTFKKMLANYANAFVYCWFHPKVGLWFGATPETLLHTEKKQFKTMSLAGTQLYTGTDAVVWKGKELEEQQLVTDFIAHQLKPIALNLKINKTETIKAGSLLHLRTKVAGVLKQDSSLKDLIRGLHPTPAVCGLPRERTKKFIIKNENYNRAFYTGFLGELNLEEHNTSLFVNLRCMNVDDEEAFVYVGGGITKDSNPEKEWEETVSKSKTMRQVL